MKRKFDNVCQFTITIMGITPAIWRRVQVPETYTFWDFHVAIQDAFGWTDSHLHEFELKEPETGKRARIGLPVDQEDLYGDDSSPLRPDWDEKIADWFSRDNPAALYRYDFGDDWEHAVFLEEILPREPNVRYPVCLDGKRACPPEDIMGIPGYEAILSGESPFQEFYEDYDAERFDLAAIKFTNPAKRLKSLFKD